MESPLSYFSFLDDHEDHHDGVVGFEEGSCRLSDCLLPPHVLDDHHQPAAPYYCQQFNYKQSSRPHQYQNHHHHNRRRPKYLDATRSSNPRYHHRHDQQQQSSKSSSILFHQKPRFPVGSRVWAGPGMQAVFLETSQKQCGTGFFLPRKAGNTFQPSKKPACSPVLLPSRVVQALNLNVHELGPQLTPRRDQKNNFQVENKDSNKSRNVRDNDNDAFESVSSLCSVASQAEARNSSPEIFLPKEWSY